MADDVNMNYVNKYVNVVKTRHDALANEVITLQVNSEMLKESLDEHVALVTQLKAKIEELEAQLSKKTSRSTTSKKTEEETF